MNIEGRRIHIAGSASADADPRLIEYGHSLIYGLVRKLATHEATFLVGVGKEPRIGDQREGLPIIFDWTVICALYECLNSGLIEPSSWRGPILTTIATSKTKMQIPENRIEIWEKLLKLNAVQVEYIEPGWSSGAVRRIRMVELGDVLIALSGGEGVEHLINEYSLRGKPVLPFDLDLGSSTGDGTGGAARFAGIMKAHPERFFRLLEPSVAGALISKMVTDRGTVSESNVVGAVVKILESMEPPTAFYVRLLDHESEKYPAVERFFRNVVDRIVEEGRYKRVELGLSPSTHSWMNVEIFDTLHNSALVVVDLTDLRSNCLIELGYALGRARRTIVTAEKSTRIPFDSSMIECYLWDDEAPADVKVRELKDYWYRNINRPPIVKPRGVL